MKTKLLKRFRKPGPTWEQIAEQQNLGDAYIEKHEKAMTWEKVTKLINKQKYRGITLEQIGEYRRLSEAYYEKHKKSMDFFQKLIS